MRAHRGKWFYLIITISFLAVVSVSLAIAAEKASNEGKAKGNEKVAVVNGTLITRADFDREMETIQKQFVAMGQPVSPERMSQIRNNVLDNLISSELLYQQAEKDGIQVEPAEIDKKFATLKQRFPDEAEFKKILEKMNLNEETLRSQLQRGLIVEQLVDKEVIQKITIPDTEVKSYYDGNPAMFTQPEQVRASHILIKVDKSADASQKELARKKIEEIQQKIKDGGDFAALAKEFSQCPSSAKGGDLGYFRRGQMVKPFEDAAFSLKAGEVSDIVETQFGYHIIKVVDKKAEAVMPFDEVKERLGQYLKQEKAQKEVAAYIAKLKADSKIEKFLEAPSEKSDVKPAENTAGAKEETKKQ
jgi:peptidyl-prolyl cis-trans isomerase C